MFQSCNDNKFIKLFNNEKLSDIQLFFGNRKLYVHSIVLSSASPLFMTMVDQTLNEQKLDALLDERYETVYDFIKFIYTKDVHIIHYENWFYLLKLALIYEVHELEQNILAFICRNTGLRNTLKHFDFFVSINYRFMIEHYKCAIAVLLRYFLDTQEYLKLSLTSLNELLDIHVVYNKVNVYEIIHSIMKWGENKRSGYPEDNQYVREIFGDVVKRIKFTSMSMEEFACFMNVYPNFLEDTEINSLKNAIKKKPNDSDFTMEPFIRQALRVPKYNYLEGELVFNVIFTTVKSVEILGIWIGGTREGRTCQVKLLNENGVVMDRVTTSVMILNQYEFPIKFRPRMFLEPNQQYQIIVVFERTHCGVAEWNNLENNDIVGCANVDLIKKSRFIRKIHFEKLL